MFIEEGLNKLKDGFFPNSTKSLYFGSAPPPPHLWTKFKLNLFTLILAIVKARMYYDSSCYLYIFLESFITIILTYYVCLILAPPEGFEKVSPWTQ